MKINESVREEIIQKLLNGEVVTFSEDSLLAWIWDIYDDRNAIAIPFQKEENTYPVDWDSSYAEAVKAKGAKLYTVRCLGFCSVVATTNYDIAKEMYDYCVDCLTGDIPQPMEWDENYIDHMDGKEYMAFEEV